MSNVKTAAFTPPFFIQVAAVYGKVLGFWVVVLTFEF